jgi:hypothetical protein
MILICGREEESSKVIKDIERIMRPFLIDLFTKEEEGIKKFLQEKW